MHPPNGVHCHATLLVPGGETRRVLVYESTMPTDLSDVSTGGVNLLFADDLQGTVLQLRKASAYDADEVTDPGEVPEFGTWLPVETEQYEEAWAVAVSELVEELQRFESPTAVRLEVTRCEKSGPSQTDPYEVNVEQVDTTGQASL